MNKLFSKIAALSVGLAMAIGVGVAVGSNGVKEAKAAAGDKYEETTLSSGAEVVIVGNNGSNYAMGAAGGTSSAPTAISVTISNSELTSTTDLADHIWVVSGSSSGWTFTKKGGDAALYCTNTNNGVRVGSNSNNKFTISNEGYLLNSGTSRYVGIYNSQDWRCYTSIGANIKDQTFSFWKVKSGSTPAVLTGITLDVSGAQTEYFDGDSASTSGLTVTAHYDTAADADVTSLATITPNPGTVSLTTDSIEYTATYSGKTDMKSVDVTVSEKPHSDYVETVLEEGNLLITTSWDGDTYYLPTATSSGAAPAAVKFSDVSEIDTANLWKVTKDSSSWVFQNSDDEYLAITGTSNNSIRIGSTSGSWAVQEDGSLKGANDRYLGIYNGADWRSYNSSTATNYKESATSLKFYKVNSVDPSKKNMTIYTSDSPAEGQSVDYKPSGSYQFVAKEDSTSLTDVTWAVSDETVATINASTGALSCVKPGSVTVYAEKDGYNKASASITIAKGSVSSLAVSGAMSKKAYTTAESWSHDGLVATATYSTGWVEDVSSSASWTYNPENPAVGVESVVATASFGGKSASSSAQTVTVSRVNPIQALYSKAKGDSCGEFYAYYAGFAPGSGPIIMDGEYGIMLYNSSQDVSEWVVGETIVHVTAGTIDIYNGLYEIKSYTLTTVESGDVSPMITHITTGSESASQANRSTNATGVVAAAPTKGSFEQEPAASDVQFTFTVGSNTFTVYYKKASQTATVLASLKDSLDNGTEITLDGFTSWFNSFQVTMVGLIEAKVDYTAAAFAQDLLDQTDALCSDYPGDKDPSYNYNTYKASLVAIWSDLASADKYPSLPTDQKTILAEALRNESGTVVERAMARYDFLTGKYELSNFINGRTPIVLAGGRFVAFDTSSDSTAIIVIIIAAVSALAFTSLLVFKKKKQK